MFTTLTPMQLQAATKEQIAANVAQVAAGMTKRELIVALLGSEQVVDPPVVTRNKQGELLQQVETVRDAVTGDVLATKTIDWAYFATGEVKAITTAETVAGKAQPQTVISHFKDGKQPTVSIKAAVEEPIGGKEL